MFVLVYHILLFLFGLAVHVCIIIFLPCRGLNKFLSLLLLFCCLTLWHGNIAKVVDPYISDSFPACINFLYSIGHKSSFFYTSVCTLHCILYFIYSEMTIHLAGKNLKNLLSGNSNKCVKEAFSKAFCQLKDLGASDRFLVAVRHSGCNLKQGR